MSSLSTPTRIGRGLIVPGIDTNPISDKSNTALSYGGLHTPPQSAHESRRTSLQYNALPEAPYSASSYSYSQPVTPVHGFDHGNDFFHQRWSQAINTDARPDTNLSLHQSRSPLEEQPVRAAFESKASYSTSLVDSLAGYSHMNQTNDINDFAFQVNSSPPIPGVWSHSQEICNGYATHGTSLGSTLFPLPHGMNFPTNSPSSVFHHAGSSFHTLDYHYQPSTMAVAQSYGAPPTLYQQPQVVIPSQLSPQEDYSEQQSSCDSPSRSHDIYHQKYEHASVSFNGYELVGPPSPQDVYFAHSEDEDYLMVKPEQIDSPAFGSSSRKLADLPLRSKRRASRRTRKAGGRTPWHRHELNGCVIDCEGKQCYLEPLKLNIASNKKPFRCTFVDKHGEACTSRFDRSEHLKRHEGKHSDERKYPCPLCTRKIGRPDNAGDHFKTHLRPKTPGKRNSHYEWPQVHNAIWDNYEDKKVAKKLLDGLSRWINLGMPDASSSKRSIRTERQ